MKDYRLTQALGSISDDLLLEATEVKKKRSMRGSLLRIAAVAAVLLVVCTLLLLNSQDTPTPFFSVYVHASETESIELSPNEITCAVSNIISEGNPNFSSNLFPEEAKSYFSLEFQYSDYTKESSTIDIFCNGENINGSKEIFRGFTGSSSGITGLCVLGTVDIASRIDVIMYGDGKQILQEYTFIVTPVEEGYRVELIESYIAHLG